MASRLQMRDAVAIGGNALPKDEEPDVTRFSQARPAAPRASPHGAAVLDGSGHSDVRRPISNVPANQRLSTFGFEVGEIVDDRRHIRCADRSLVGIAHFIDLRLPLRSGQTRLSQHSTPGGAAGAIGESLYSLSRFTSSARTQRNWKAEPARELVGPG
jgi:hypothetical protein